MDGHHNDVSGVIVGPSVQAQVIHGDIHIGTATGHDRLEGTDARLTTRRRMAAAKRRAGRIAIGAVVLVFVGAIGMPSMRAWISGWYHDETVTAQHDSTSAGTNPVPSGAMLTPSVSQSSAPPSVAPQAGVTTTTRVAPTTRTEPATPSVPVHGVVSLLDNWKGAVFQQPSGTVNGQNYPRSMSTTLGCVRGLNISHPLPQGHPPYFKGSIGMVDPGPGQTTGIDFLFELDGQKYSNALPAGSDQPPVQITIPVASVSLITIVVTTAGAQCQSAAMALVDPELTY